MASRQGDIRARIWGGLYMCAHMCRSTRPRRVPREPLLESSLAVWHPFGSARPRGYPSLPRPTRINSLSQSIKTHCTCRRSNLQGTSLSCREYRAQHLRAESKLRQIIAIISCSRFPLLGVSTLKPLLNSPKPVTRLTGRLQCYWKCSRLFWGLSWRWYFFPSILFFFFLFHFPLSPLLGSRTCCVSAQGAFWELCSWFEEIELDQRPE